MKRRPTHYCTTTSKTRFRDKKEAVTAQHRLATTSAREVVPKRAYKCKPCKGWHLSSYRAPVVGGQPTPSQVHTHHTNKTN